MQAYRRLKPYLALKDATKTSISCHMWEAKQELPAKHSFATIACLAKTRPLPHLSTSKSLSENEKNASREEMPMLSPEPLLATFPFLGVKMAVDLNSFLRFELMHNLSFEVSCLLKECF